MKSKLQRVANTNGFNHIQKSTFVNRKSFFGGVMVRPEGFEPSTH
jgi:hypothetical protein